MPYTGTRCQDNITVKENLPGEEWTHHAHKSGGATNESGVKNGPNQRRMRQRAENGEVMTGRQTDGIRNDLTREQRTGRLTLTGRPDREALVEPRLVVSIPTGARAPLHGGNPTPPHPVAKQGPCEAPQTQARDSRGTTRQEERRRRRRQGPSQPQKGRQI